MHSWQDFVCFKVKCLQMKILECCAPTAVANECVKVSEDKKTLKLYY